jgi:NAD(P)-dependent dehydrogenase (short-subunit alcohol dehydrogenase family)
MRKTVLITGCSSGLGNTSAKKFASEGWNVIATMRKPDERLANEHPERILVTRLDVTEPSSIQEAIAAGIAKFGQIDVVVNNAGVSVPSIFEATPMKVVRSIYETNVFGVMNVIQAITPYFRQQQGGTIVNISSNIGYAAFPLLSVYTSTKHALEGLVESLSYELESQHILIKLVEPGYMPTTNFGANSVGFAGELSTPPEYQPYFNHMMQSLSHSPFEPADEHAVADQVIKAASDPTNRLRYVAGPDAEETAQLRWTQSEDKYMATMRALLGHTAWCDSQK